MKKIAVIILAASLAGCSSFTPPRYSISADNNVALKEIGVGHINVGDFQGPAKFDNFCRGAGPIAPPDKMSFHAYVQKALADELKVAGLYDDKTPKVTLTGKVNALEFSSSRGLTGGSWNISLTLTSSNGQSMSMKEYYEFESGFVADTACKQTAEAFMPTVQNLISKIVRSPEFKKLVG
jgi:hypothetical protein